MRSNFFTFILLFLFSTLGAQDTFKSDILAQINDLETKLNSYKDKLQNTDFMESVNLYTMNADFQENINSISDKIYEFDVSQTLMGNEESIEEIEETEMPEIDSYDEEGTSQYKSDIKVGDDFKSKVMKSMDDFAFVLGWGINSMTYEEGNEIAHKLWGSSNWEVGFVNKRQIGTSKARVVYGLTLNTHYFKLDDANISSTKAAPGYLIEDDNTFNDVRFGVRYLQVPLGIGFKLGSKTEVFVGGHAGFKIKGYTNKEFKTNQDEEINQYAKANYGLNKFNYGLDLSIGAKAMRVFGKYDLNPLFREGSSHNVFTFGLRYGY